MPTAADYWAAAEDFTSLARSMTAEATPLRAAMTDGVVLGGRLRATLEQAIDTIATELDIGARCYEAAAQECRRRAAAWVASPTD